VTDAALRLVSFGNAFLLARYDGDAYAKAAISRGIARWRFDTLQARPHGIAPLRTVARDPYGWFRWLRKKGYSRLVLRWLSPAEYAALDGPLKVFTTREYGYMAEAEHAHELSMLWNAWRVDAATTWRGARAAKVEFRGSEVFALPQRAPEDVDALLARLDMLFAEASALVPGDAPAYERARAALNANDPERAIPAAELPMLAPSTHPLGARRLMTAVLLARRAGDGHHWRDDPPLPRPVDYAATIRAAVVAAVNAIA
jgi:hypothetical protein